MRYPRVRHAHGVSSSRTQDFEQTEIAPVSILTTTMAAIMWMTMMMIIITMAAVRLIPIHVMILVVVVVVKIAPNWCIGTKAGCRKSTSAHDSATTQMCTNVTVWSTVAHDYEVDKVGPILLQTQRDRVLFDTMKMVIRDECMLSLWLRETVSPEYPSDPRQR